MGKCNHQKIYILLEANGRSCTILTDGPDGVVGPECGGEAEVGVETGMLASTNVTIFVENVDFIGVERAGSTDSCYTPGPTNRV